MVSLSHKTGSGILSETKSDSFFSNYLQFIVHPESDYPDVGFCGFSKS